MKKYLSIVFLISVIVGSLTLDSCKKGENDPFISLRSRKARMTGDWIISKYSYEYTDIYIDGEQFYYKLAQDGEKIAETQGWTNTTGGKDTTWTWGGKIITDRTLSFDKDGEVSYKYHYIISEFYPDPDEDNPEKSDTTISYERIFYNTGTWNFLGKVDDYKNKERITIMWQYVDYEQIWNEKVVSYNEDDDDVLPVETNTSKREQSRSYYDNGEITEAWVLDKLKNKEIMMFRNIDRNIKYNVGSSALENTTTDGYEQYDLEQE